ncbi:MAG: gamma-glutamylcyclotransferase family protein [Marinomonas sp.]|uniref:Gamma-glutamylcyclotransferase n=1 Tax=Marinomonas pontica TaxID=264739 RepID=A0ABM8F8W1_9GAMM|nr:gamma-glutamylcyclotransferase family protein [Marinomonas pontica]MCW8356941.1 gamma-glutamylcyclotransferase [Marinomonas pontica]BDX01376.1 gamma-glutamylcyclotransferase [Marinomonas pontica]
MSVLDRHFILGYGSLINGESRAKTGETGHVWPVKLHGFERHWSVMSVDYGMSSVAVVHAPDKACNGVLVEVPFDQFALFDEREKGYQRAKINAEQLTAYQDDPLPTGTYWVYHTDDVVEPHHDCPIALSYLDVILSGCLEHGDAFAQDFLVLTKGWSSPLLNDRQAPRYPRVQPDLSTARLNTLLAPVTTLSIKELSVTYES